MEKYSQLLPRNANESRLKISLDQENRDLKIKQPLGEPPSAVVPFHRAAREEVAAKEEAKRVHPQTTELGSS